MKNIQNENPMKDQDIFNKTDKTYVQQMSKGCLTIINQNSIQFKHNSEDNTNLIHFPLEKSRNVIKDYYPINVNKCMKKQLKLIKIMAIKQRRSQFKEITNHSLKQIEQNNGNNIEIVTRVYDNMSNRFENMCKYYGFLNINDLNLDYNYQNCQNSEFQKCFKRKQFQQQFQSKNYKNQLMMKTEDTDLFSQFSKFSETDSSFSPNTRKQIKKQKLKQRSQNYELTSNQIKNDQPFKTDYHSLNVSPSKHSPQSIQRRCLENQSPLFSKHQQNISENNTPRHSQNLKQQSKERQIQYDSSSSDLGEDNRRLVQKSLKIISEQAEEEDKYYNKQDKLNLITSKQMNKQQNIFSCIDSKEKLNNLQLIPNIPSQQNFVNQFEKLSITNQQVRSYEQQNKFYEQLQLLITNPKSLHQNSFENTLEILQKCIYLTQASHVHSIIQNLIQDFGNVSQIKTCDYDLQNLTEQKEEESVTGQKQKDQSCFRLSCRASTSFSRNSMTTQPLSCKTQSIPSISNITSSACINNIENIKIELIEESNQNKEKPSEFKQNQFDGLIEQQESIKLISEKKQDDDQSQKRDQSKIKNHFSSSQTQQRQIFNCKSFFKLNSLTQQQLNQFKFSQYKKKNSSNISQICGSFSPKNSSNQNKGNDTQNVSKFGKFHNYNKLFMYNILNMFQPNNLAYMNVPEVISKELQLLISRIKTSAKNNYKVEGKYAFDYFSHAHYNVLFLQLTQENISHLSQQEEYVSLYKTCFNLDLTEQISQITLTYTNIIKTYCYQIFIDCIREEDIKIDNSLSQENLKNQYTLKVIKGIKKLSQGQIIKRF